MVFLLLDIDVCLSSIVFLKKLFSWFLIILGSVCFGLFLVFVVFLVMWCLLVMMFLGMLLWDRYCVCSVVICNVMVCVVVVLLLWYLISIFIVGGRLVEC